MESVNCTSPSASARTENPNVLLYHESHPCIGSYSLRYTWLVILIISIISIIAIADRFTINVLPSGTNDVSPFKEELTDNEWTASTFFLIGFATGRILTATSALMFALQCRCFWNYFFEFLKPKWMIIHDIMIENDTMHYYLGIIGVGAPCIIHCFVLFLPLISPNISFEFYNQWHRPPECGFYHDYNINMSFQDLNGFAIVTLCFCILFPLSMYRRFRNLHWTTAQYIHLVGAVAYTVELLRIEFKNNCYYCTLPFVVLYVIDRLYGIFIYRKTKLQLVSKYSFDTDYTLFLFTIEDDNRTPSLGDVYYINFEDDFLKCKPSHPYTVFYNHSTGIDEIMPFDKNDRRLSASNHKFPISPTGVMDRRCTDINIAGLSVIHADTQEINAPHPIDIAGVLNAIDEDRKTEDTAVHHSPVSMSVDVFTHHAHHGSDGALRWDIGIVMHTNDDDDNAFRFSKKMFNLKPDERFNIIGYGPYRAAFGMIFDVLNDKYPILLIGTGAGISYIIDFYLFITANNVTLYERVEIYVLCRSIRLFQWVTDILCKKSINNLEIYAHLTSKPNIKSSSFDDKNKQMKGRIGRASFDDVFKNSKPNTRVFFCGSPQLQNKVGQYCNEYSFKFYKGHTFI
eukprot:106828_1